ncbi:hypothetical protein [Paenarthrobacter sp. NPDC018779]|uniref:hypothetical protein n=1 Tax=Paenarthrobacter sp. NPDC018779 TaxID=3364375 RepID=UPI0037C5C26F
MSLMEEPMCSQKNADAPMARFQDALGDYCDAGMIGDAPRLEDFNQARWGIDFRGLTEYDTEEEARRQFELAQMDVPARLVVNHGEGWVVTD